MSATSHGCILNSICEFIIDCEHKTASTQEDGYPSIRTPNIGRGRLILESVNRVSEETYNSWTQRAIPREGDLILAREAPVGNVAIIPKNLQVCLGQRTVLIRPDRLKVDPNYLVYLLLGDRIQGKIQSLTGGATVAHLNMGEIRKLELPTLPPLPTQQKIAAILSAYDDLIENNTRRIKILEEMAQIIYQEWFVNFRFPGHEGMRMVESELGPVPEGWEVVKVSEKFKTILGGTPSRVKPEYWENGSIPWINSGKVNELRIISPSELITKIGYDNSSTKLMPKRTTLIAITGATLGQVSLLEIEACGNQSIVGICDIEGLYSEFLYLTISSNISSIIKHASGGAQQHINKEIINDVKILLPPKSIIDQFSVFEKPIFDMIEKIILKNANLRRTRDLLLPKLISGEIDVSELEILIPEEMVT